MATLRQLRYLQALVQHRHFGRAAEACAVSQPALSMQIRDLEKELGVELVERRPGEAALTDVGLEVARRGERVLAATRDLVDFARHRGRMSLRPAQARHHSDAGALSFCRRCSRILQARYPDLTVELRETQTKALIEELAGGELDAIMLALPLPDAEIETIRLFDDRFPARGAGRRSAAAQRAASIRARSISSA